MGTFRDPCQNRKWGKLILLLVVVLPMAFDLHLQRVVVRSPRTS